MTSRLLTRAALALALVASVACFRGRLPAVELYRLAPVDSSASSTPLADAAASLEGAIAVAPYSTPGIYGARGIAYRIGETGYGSYPYREWAIPLGEMLGMRTADVMRHVPISSTGGVYDPPSRRQYRYVWRGLVREFEEVNRGKSVFAAVALEARLVRATDDSVIWVGSQRMERPVPSGTMTSIVETLSELSTEVIRALLAEAKKAAPASGGTPASRNP